MDCDALKELRGVRALSIIRYQPQGEVDETVRVNRAFLVDLAQLTPRVLAPLFA